MNITTLSGLRKGLLDFVLNLFSIFFKVLPTFFIKSSSLSLLGGLPLSCSVPNITRIIKNLHITSNIAISIFTNYTNADIVFLSVNYTNTIIVA